VLLLLGEIWLGVRPWFSGNRALKFWKSRSPEKFQGTRYSWREWEN